jgi:hypothetical protein
MSTKDQILSSALHREALFAAKRPEMQPLIDHLREVAQGRDDIASSARGSSPEHGSPASASEAKTSSLPGS